MNILKTSNLTAAMETARTFQTGQVNQTSQTRQYNNINNNINKTDGKMDVSRRFDSVSIDNRRGSFEMELRGKLKQEIRAATSSGQIAELRERVQDGSYQPDVTAIARKMLLIGGAV